MVFENSLLVVEDTVKIHDVVRHGIKSVTHVMLVTS